MSMSAALSNVFSFDRTRARFRSDRIDQHEDAAEEERAISPPASPTMIRRSIRRGNNGGGINSTASSAAPSLTSLSENSSSSGGTRSIRLGRSSESSHAPASSSETSPTNSTGTSSSSGSEANSPSGLSSSSSGDIETGNSPSSAAPIVFSAATPRAVAVTSSTSMTLAELEEERELARRRSSLCILLASFVLFRLWVSAIQEGDFGLMLLCLVGTSWTARWISYNREREEELDRRITNYLEHQENGTAGGGDPSLDRSELRMLSFQAQLALAIMESQRQMMQGGYGHPDGSEAQAPGVSDEAKARWKHVKFVKAGESNSAGYGSVAQKDKASSHLDDDEPHCSICLCEYEDGDDTIKLPCGHLYHDECISSWTENHVKCPLCNYDLELAAGRESTDAAVIGAGSGGAATSEIV